MKFVTRLTHANKAVNVYLPVKEKKLQMLCDDLGLANDMQAKVVVDELASDARLEKIFKDQEYGLNEFNFLMRRLDSLNEAELFSRKKILIP